MKTFLNVLYRKILYKIPLKFLLLLLAIFGLLFASCNAGLILEDTTNINGNYQPYYYSNNYDIICVELKSCNEYGINAFSVAFPYDTGGYYDLGNVSLNYNHVGNWNPDLIPWGLGLCTTGEGMYIINAPGVICEANLYSYSFDVYSSMQCQIEYNLMPIENVDSNYCESNNLCSNNGNCENNGSGNWSAIYINDIQHIGGPSIYIGIPEEIERDYSYVDDDMYINVDGYNVDYEKIEGIIDVQNYKPSQEDFNNIIGILADYMPIIVIFLGLLFIYKMIRKPFKSKL